jgi:hypothetical protein
MFKQHFAAALVAFASLLGLASYDATDTGTVIRTTASYALRHVDAQTFADATAGALTVTLPSAPGLSLMKQFRVCKDDLSANVVTVQDGAGFTKRLAARDHCATFQSNRATSTQTSTAAGGERWAVVAESRPALTATGSGSITGLPAQSKNALTSVTVTGAAVGDEVTTSFTTSDAAATMILTGHVTAANTVRLDIHNYGSGSLTTNYDYRVVVRKH